MPALHLDLRSVEGVGNALLMLQHGRIDLLATNERNSRPWIEALPAGSLVQLQPAIDSKDGYFAFPGRALRGAQGPLRRDLPAPAGRRPLRPHGGRGRRPGTE